MKRISILLIVACMFGCLHNPDAPPANYYQDDIYCYHKNADGTYQNLGLANQCPANTRYIVYDK